MDELLQYENLGHKVENYKWATKHNVNTNDDVDDCVTLHYTDVNDNFNACVAPQNAHTYKHFH